MEAQLTAYRKRLWKLMQLSKLGSAEGCLAATLLGLAPLLGVQCVHLCERPHFQFFPLAWLALILLLVTRAKITWTDRVSHERAGLTAWVVGLMTGAFAAYIFSPWLGQVAGILCVMGWGLLRLAAVPWVRWLGWTLLLWVTLPLPGNLDRDLVNNLQMISSESAGALLDLIGLVHFRQGNLIEIRAGKLFIDEACSGVDSLYALFASALIMMLWQRRPLVIGLFTLLTVPIWAWLGNLLRLVLIVWLLDRWGIDFSRGWKHTLVGLTFFALSSAGLFSTLDAFTSLFKRFSTGALPRDRKAWHLTYNAIVCFPSPAPELPTEEEAYFDSSETVKTPITKGRHASADNLRQERFMDRTLFTTCILAALIIGGISLRAIANNRDSLVGLPHFESADVDKIFNESTLPQTLQNAQRIEFSKEERSLDNYFGEHSRTWKYQDSQHKFLLSADFPFRGFHPLSVCYRSVGNVIDGAPVRLHLPTNEQGQESPEPSVQRIKLKDGIGYTSYVWFSIFESNGRPVKIREEQETSGTSLISRLLDRNAANLEAEPVTYQFQLYVQSGSDLEAAELDRYLAIYAEALPSIVERVKQLKSYTRRQRSVIK